MRFMATFQLTESLLLLLLNANTRCFIRMRRKTSPFMAEISGADCEAVLKTLNFSQAYFAAQYIAE